MDSALPKVSIGLITFNHADFIVECLDSIRSQTYQNIELFISDDCSTDDTVSIIKNYIEQHPGLIKEFLQQPSNVGISLNCNLLLEKFTGEYGHIFSGDDIMLPEKTRLQVEALEANPDASLCFTNVEWFWSETGKKICNHFGWLQRPSIKLEDIVADFLIPSPSIMLRLDKIAGLRYNLDVEYINDFLFSVEALLLGDAVYIDQVTVRYRKHKNSLTVKQYFFEDRRKVVELLRQKLPPRYNRSLQAYDKIVEYAKIMEMIGSKQKWKALAHTRVLFPDAIMSRKWMTRLCLIFLELRK